MLTDQQLEVLEFERLYFRDPAAKRAEIRQRFDVTTTRYFQILNCLLDDPNAMRASPQVVARLRRIRVERQRARTPRDCSSTN